MPGVAGHVGGGAQNLKTPPFHPQTNPYQNRRLVWGQLRLPPTCLLFSLLGRGHPPTQGLQGG